MNKKRLFQIGIAATICAILLIPGDLFVIGQVVVDTTVPTISITEPLNGANLGIANVSISGNVTHNVEVSSVEIFLDNISQGSPTITPANGTTLTWNMTLTQLSQGTHNITARASDNANNTQSAMVSFVVDTEPPSITAPSPITIEVNTSGGAHSHPDITDFLAAVIIVDSIDPSPTGTNNASSFFPLGTTAVTFTATDAAGNSASDSSNINVVDTGQPIIAISQPVNGTKLNTTSITLNGTFSDFTETSVGLLVDNVSQGNAELNNTEWTKTVTLTEGSHTITAIGTDSSNNTASTSIDVVIDTTAPTLRITSPARNATLNTSNVALTGTSADANGVASIHVSIDNSTFTQANGTNSWSFNAIIADGTHNITVRATDMAGNVSKANVTIMVNTMINEITITSPVEGVKLNTSNVTITGSVTNSSHVQSIEVAIDGGVSLPVSLNTTSGIWTFGPVDLVDGNHTAQAALTDLTNNTAIVTTSFVIDTTAPVISIVSPANNATLTTTNVMLNGTASDVSGITSVVVSMNGGSTSAATLEPSTGNWSFQAALTNGTHRITVTATDMAGNQAMASISVNIIDDTVIDRMMPSVDIISLGVTAIINGTNANRFNVTISGTASDNDGLASVQVKIDND